MTTNKQQTAVEWQHVELSKFLHGKSEFTDAHDILIKAKEMGKDQMIEFAVEYTYGTKRVGASLKEDFIKLYEQTYEGGEQ
jgi:hypothetical protein